MGFDGAHTNVQAAGNLFIAQTLGDASQYFLFPRREFRGFHAVTAHEVIEIARGALNHFVRGDGMETAELTPREKEVLTRIAEGLSNKEIAGRLDVGVRTVETHRERLMRKLDIHNV